LAILERLEHAGYEAFFVGGYVRDKCWGKPVKDIDIATSALPAQVVSLFERTIPTGLKHGTVTVLAGGTPYEVTTYRKESDYVDYRRPSEVEFISDLEEDLKRRDFTMNAMAMDRRGDIRDPFGGQADMEKMLLRCVGEPEERFQEDALRMLRCIRFASTYGLEVEKGTWNALLTRRELLSHVAMERVRVELERMVAGPAPLRGWSMLLDSGLLTCLKEPLAWRYRSMPVNGMPGRLQALKTLHQPLHRWSLILLEAGLSPDELRSLLRSLTFSLKDTERIAKTAEVQEWLEGLAGLDETDRPSDGIPSCSLADRWKLLSLRLGAEALMDWISVHEAAVPFGTDLPESGSTLLHSGVVWLEEMPASDLKELAVSGKDLIVNSGQSAGPWVGLTMQRLLKLVALGRISNTKDALFQEAFHAGTYGGTE
jgi:tRNA nucleotidyltransferase (CCA-adding enzyme)